MTELEKEIRSLAEVKGLNMKAICRAAKIPESTLYRVFKEESNFSIHTLRRIADALGCKIKVLLIPLDKGDRL